MRGEDGGTAKGGDGDLPPDLLSNSPFHSTELDKRDLRSGKNGNSVRSKYMGVRYALRFIRFVLDHVPESAN